MRYILVLLTIFFTFVANAQRQHLIFESSFENPSLSEWSDVQKCFIDRVSVSTTIKKIGVSSGKFYSKWADTLGCTQVRSQVIFNDTDAINYERWYGFSFYLGSSYPLNYDGVENFIEFFRTDTTESLYPLALAYQGYEDGIPPNWLSGKYFTTVRMLRTDPPASPYTMFIDPLKTVNNQEWVDVVMRVKWSNDTTGRIRIWVNDVLAFTYNGITNYGPNNLRVGIDKWDWRLNWNVSTTTERELYIDEFRIGNSLATYNDVRPGYNNPLPIHWLSFIATKNVNSVKLFWEANFGTNFEKFIVERNTGTGWIALGQVYDNPIGEYNFIDQNPETLNQYRIKAINLGEADAYSDVRIVRFYGYQPLKISIFNTIGQLVRVDELNTNNLNSYMKSLNLKSGIYFIRYENGQTEKYFVNY